MKRLFIAVLGAVFLWASVAVAKEASCDEMKTSYVTALKKRQAFAGVGISERGYALTLYAGRGGFTLFGNPDAHTACILDSGPVWRWAIEYAI